MIRVNTHSAKTNLSALLLKVENNSEQVTICRNGRPVARLCPMKRFGKNSRGAKVSQMIEIMKGKSTKKLSTDEIMDLTRGN